MSNLTHELEWISYFGTIAWRVGMPDGDAYIVMDAFLKAIINDGQSRLR